MAKITGNGDGTNGRNETYRVGNRFGVDRQQLVREVEAGLHENYHTVGRGPDAFVRGNPNGSSGDNVDRD
ncbi:MAG: hypothetical protein ACRBBO_07325 [Cognatishimia sp.]